ncbi:MAG: DUF4232 domain-containing protein [Actinomycetota bacterium]|nr:DUF4232 domain-containing protein [Actinomycetota bacterium]MDQ6947448.1 DUF4232 domain-containing protein [Actinomycetota bacterium]
MIAPTRHTAVAVALVAIFALSACGGGGSSTATPTSPRRGSSRPTTTLATVATTTGVVPSPPTTFASPTTAVPSPPATQPANTRGQTSPSGTTTCSGGQLQVVVRPSQGAGGGTIAGGVSIRNIGAVCTMQGFPTLQFLNASGATLPSYVARSNDPAVLVTLAAHQPPVPTFGSPGYAAFELLGTNMTSDNQPCPLSRQEQGPVLRAILPGGAAFSVDDSGPLSSTFSSCDGRIQVGPVS